ncbi:hypothetical protein RCL_jg3402.t3 [Rhizophagus clarus]|uniref:Uncharacterized protein n=1 Tax=Rhizophagus clarus TaxID=94130 RepID=A0A8H3R232_9GLOM|nr:hypothetical protein RCL_jg3402.t3 [Rhizophagus clarus]
MYHTQSFGSLLFRSGRVEFRRFRLFKYLWTWISLQILSGSLIFGLMKNTRVTESLNVLTARFLNMNMNVWLLISCGKFDSWQDEYIYDLLTLCRKFDDRTSKRSVYWISGGGFSKGLKVSDFWVNGKADLTLNLTFDLCNSGFD